MSRLEEIKKRLVLLHNAIDVDDETKNYIFKDLKVEWLIERVQELKKDRDALEIKIDKAYRDTQRYKQALEFYADRDNYKLEHFDPNLDDYMSTVDYDEGKTARNALEGEE